MSKSRTLFASIFLIFSLNACTSASDKTPEIAVGEISKQVLLAEYAEFSHQFDKFSLTDKQIEQVRSWPKELVIDVYFGTWCHDSQREVPRLLKALLENQQIKVNLYALDGKKSDPQGRAKKAGVKYTPTMIVTLAGKQIGRIIESPKQDLITDINNFILAAS